MDEYGYVGMCPDDLRVPVTARPERHEIDVEHLVETANGEHLAA